MTKTHRHHGVASMPLDRAVKRLRLSQGVRGSTGDADDLLEHIDAAYKEENAAGCQCGETFGGSVICSSGSHRSACSVVDLCEASGVHGRPVDNFGSGPSSASNSDEVGGSAFHEPGCGGIQAERNAALRTVHDGDGGHASFGGEHVTVGLVWSGDSGSRDVVVDGSAVPVFRGVCGKQDRHASNTGELGIGSHGSGGAGDGDSDSESRRSGDDDLDVPSIAAFALAALKGRGRPFEEDKASCGSTDDEEDLLQHLEEAYKMENTKADAGHVCGGELTGREDELHHGECDKPSDADELNIDEFAKYVVSVLKWKHAVDSETPSATLPGNAVKRPIEGASCRRRALARKRYHASQSEHVQSVPPSRRLLEPVSKAERTKALHRLQEALGPQGLDECVCVVCDRLVLRCEATRVDAADWRYMAKMRRSLGEVDATLPRRLIDAYCAPVYVSNLMDVMVSPRSFCCYTDSGGHLTAWFTVCKACNSSIERGCLPKFAIANGFYIGCLPDPLRDLTLPERFLTQLVSLAATTRVMRGGRHRCIRSHCIAFDCTPSPPVMLLPRSAADLDAFRVAMVGNFTDSQTEKVKKMHEIRGQKVRDVLNFYRLHNPLYSDVTQDDDALQKLIEAERVEQLLIDYIEDENGEVEDGVNEQQENIRGHSDAWHVDSEREELSVVERRIGLSDASRVLLSHEHALVSERDSSSSNKREFLLKHSNRLAMDVSGNLLAKLFPHLFPYGRGHPGEVRRTPVSLRECVKHYTMLSGRQFGEDELFTLVSFDRISMKNMYTQNALRCQRFPAIYSGYESIGAEELGKALLENEQRRQGQRARSSDPGSLAHKFLKTVEVSSAAVWGSNAERAKCRQKAFGYQTRFGQPTLFITLTPNTDNSLVMSHYAGKTSVDSLFDILDARTASKAELREASLGNDCASARLFMRNVDAFIKHVLGMDPSTNMQEPNKGLIGEVEAYFGMVETQGRGTLHVHFLIWLKNAPSSTQELEQVFNGADGDAFRSSLESYVKSIVSNEIPLPVEKHSCVTCGASYAHLTGLDIPLRTRQNVRRGLYSARAHSSVVEPALVQCGVCKTKFSSQHILRNVLLQSRPLHWPPWECDLTSSEISEAANLESICRNTMRQAIDIVDEREKIQVALRNECRDLTAKLGLLATPDTQLLYQANSAQMVACKSDNDPFQNDELVRMIEVTPPLPSDNRMARKWMDYMVSALVVLLNQHWWCHTSSCFKLSRVTINDSYCRYLFPRERKAQTTFELSGVTLQRKVAHEFINGFNYEIMATFKCNHDIQFLLGGKDVSDRIHYCTKYVTKQQKRLDSVVVMALAAFRRRQEREKVDACIDVSSPVDSIATARKRVASMVYTMTNRQEIAGPLAALYLYRGSCCYESSSCSFVPLRDIIHQLCSTEEYYCRLVDESGNTGSSGYVAVSFLDDYIFRPDSLERVSIYEFAMKYFRKRDTHSLVARLPFKPGHSLRCTHSLGMRHKEAVPVIQGFRVPYAVESSPDEVHYKRAILCLVLFKPFRSLEDLVGADDCSQEQWLLAYIDWKTSRSDFVKLIMNHIDDYYRGAGRAKAQAAQMATENAAAPPAEEDEEDSSDCDSLFSGGEFDGDEEDFDEVDDVSAFKNPWIEPDMEDGVVLDSRSVHPASCPTSAAPSSRIAEILDVFKDKKMLEGIAQSTVSNQRSTTPPDSFPAIADMRKWVANAATDLKLCHVSPISEAPSSDTRMLELFDEALDERTSAWNSQPASTCTSANPRDYASIADISQIYTLNEKQHRAFKLIGSALLRRWRKVEDMSYVNNSNVDDALEKDQLRMFLGGEGGTGKSRVLDAVHALCESWHRSDCLVKTALTGKAATVIGGRTLASLLVQLKTQHKLSSAVYLDILVIDEVSMMRKSELALLDKLLRLAKRVSGVAFGGVHVVLVGDFLQLPPVGAQPLFKDPSLSHRPTANELAGFQLWLSFDKVIVLEESVRFRADPEWGRGCHAARRGKWLPEFVNIINSRVTGNAFEGWKPGDTIPSFITPDNSTRLSINNLFISTAAKLLPKGEFPVRVVANFKGKLKKLGASEIQMVMALPDSKFGRMAPYLDLIVGMPVQITQNVRAEKMAANGTLGTLEAIIYSPQTTFRVVHDNVTDVTVKIPSAPPPAVIVRIPRGGSATSMKGCLDSDLFPLFSNAHPYNACDIKLAPSPQGMPRSLSVKIEQFPMVCAVSSTVYKVQGETLDDMVVTEWRSQNRVTNKRQQPYLLVSRVTSRNAFRTLCPLTDDICSWARPPSGALDEEDRLQQLSEKTLQSLG